MNRNNKRLCLSLSIAGIFLSALCFADGGSESHGGDECEAEFIRIGTNLRQAIYDGVSKEIKLPPGIEEADYNSRMLALLEPFLSSDLKIREKATLVECTSDKIYVGGIEKTCAWKPVNPALPDGQKIIQCNHDRYLGKQPYPKDDPGQLRETHHEWAGIAGIEPNIEGISSYFVSKQITSLGEWVPVFMVVVKGKTIREKACVVYTDKKPDDAIVEALISNGYRLTLDRTRASKSLIVGFKDDSMRVNWTGTIASSMIKSGQRVHVHFKMSIEEFQKSEFLTPSHEIEGKSSYSWVPGIPGRGSKDRDGSQGKDEKRLDGRIKRAEDRAMKRAFDQLQPCPSPTAFER